MNTVAVYAIKSMAAMVFCVHAWAGESMQILPTDSSAIDASEHVASPMVGVWSGTIGDASITACFQENYDDVVKSGSYYYHRDWIPTSLYRESNAIGEVGSIWKAAEWHLPNVIWRIDSISTDQINGTWSNEDQPEELPIRLKRLVPYAQDDPKTCGSSAYNDAIEGTLRTTAGPARSIARIKYRVLTAALPTRSISNTEPEYSMQTIQLEGDSQPIATINAALLKLMDKEEMFECRLESMSRIADESTYAQSVSISVVGRWLSILHSTSSPCGRMMQVSSNTYTWNLYTGAQESLFDWFWGMPQAANPKNIRMEEPLPKDLGDFVSARRKRAYKASDEYLESCYGTVRPNYQLILKSDGIIFEVPTTSNGSCGDSIKLSFKQLWPYLNADGRKYAKELRESRKTRQH